MLARAVVSSGLHPSIGVHHANRGNPFALADDLVEPFRPLVDAMTSHLMARGVAQVNPEAKRAFAALIAVDLPGENGTTTVTGAANRLAQSLSRCFESGRTSDLALPRLPGPIEFPRLSGLLM